jgi:predicted transposase/invertase (TIGR01784 family)
MGDNDHGYKLLFSDPAMVRDLLIGFVREDWIERIDFASLERVSGSYVSDDLRERHDDVVWRVRLAGDWLYVYVLLEFQSSVDRYMALRVMTYVALLYQDLVRTKRTTRSGRLPPVLPIVLYNGEDPWSAVTDVSRLVEDVPGQLGRYRPRLEYLLIDEGADNDVELAPEHNLVAALFRLEKSRSPDAMTEVLVRLFEWLREPQAAPLRRSFAVFLDRVYFGRRKGMAAAFTAATSPEELRTMLAKNLEKWERAAEDRGRDEERRALARKLIARGVDVELIAETTGLSKETVESLRDRK